MNVLFFVVAMACTLRDYYAKEKKKQGEKQWIMNGWMVQVSEKCAFLEKRACNDLLIGLKWQV